MAEWTSKMQWSNKVNKASLIKVSNTYWLYTIVSIPYTYLIPQTGKTLSRAQLPSPSKCWCDFGNWTWTVERKHLGPLRAERNGCWICLATMPCHKLFAVCRRRTAGGLITCRSRDNTKDPWPVEQLHHCYRLLSYMSYQIIYYLLMLLLVI